MPSTELNQHSTFSGAGEVREIDIKNASERKFNRESLPQSVL